MIYNFNSTATGAFNDQTDRHGTASQTRRPSRPFGGFSNQSTPYDYSDELVKF
jgi:hypothetical protein